MRKFAVRTAGAVLTAAAAVALLFRRRRVEPGPRGRGGPGGGDLGGVREPRRPSPAPAGAAMAVGEDGEAVQVR